MTDRIELIKYLRSIGFTRIRDHIYEKHVGDRDLFVGLDERPWFMNHVWLRGMLIRLEPPDSLFRTLEELEVAVIWHTLMDRNEPWPMVDVVPSSERR